LDSIGSVPRWHSLMSYPEPFLRWIKEYGGAVYNRELFAPVVFLSDPKAIQHVLAIDGSNYPRHPSMRAYTKENLFGSTLLNSEGAGHDNQRKMFNPHFSLSHIKAFIPIFEQLTRERLLPVLNKAAKSNELLEMNCAFQKLTLAIIGAVAFSFDFDANPAVHEAFVQMFEPPSLTTFLGLIYIPGYEYFPLPELRRRRAAKRALIEAITGVIDTKLAVKNAPKDLLDMFLPNTTPAQAIAHTMQFIVAGHETSSSTLGWLVVEVFRRRKVLAAVRSEAIRVQKKLGSVASWEATQELKYTTAVVQETLRLNTVVYSIARRIANEEDRVPMTDGSTIFIPKGTGIDVFISAMHRNPRYWSQPDDFLPERFIENTPEWMADEQLRRGSNHTFFYLPFSFGSKNCIGQRFAMAEMVVIFATIVTQFDFEIDPKCNLRPKFNGLTILPAELLVKVKHVEGIQSGIGA
ncbi:unnamed protein product, partial [Aphanomyces euteiches]